MVVADPCLVLEEPVGVQDYILDIEPVRGVRRVESNGRRGFGPGAADGGDVDETDVLYVAAGIRRGPDARATLSVGFELLLRA